MKVLFLDIDGVLNRHGCREVDQITNVFGEFDGVNPVLLDKFLTWLSDKDVKIVLSSSWRQDEHLGDNPKIYLKSKGLSWIDETPRLGHRGREIAAWLDAHDVTHWAILDDEQNNIHPVGKGLVCTSSHKGLRDKDLIKLDALLGYKI